MENKLSSSTIIIIIIISLILLHIELMSEANAAGGASRSSDNSIGLVLLLLLTLSRRLSRSPPFVSPVPVTQTGFSTPSDSSRLPLWGSDGDLSIPSSAHAVGAHSTNPPLFPERPQTVALGPLSSPRGLAAMASGQESAANKSSGSSNRHTNNNQGLCVLLFSPGFP